MSAGVPVAVVRHEVAPSASVAEGPLPLKFPILHLIMLVDLFARHRLLFPFRFFLGCSIPQDYVLRFNPHCCFRVAIYMGEPHGSMGPGERLLAFDPDIVKLGLQQHSNLPPDLGPAGGGRLLDLEDHLSPAY